jgi:hypothetical protein
MKRITPSRNAFGSQHESSSLAWNGGLWLSSLRPRAQHVTKRAERSVLMLETIMCCTRLRKESFGRWLLTRRRDRVAPESDHHV